MAGAGAVLFRRVGGTGPQPGFEAAAGVLPATNVYDVLPGDLDGDGDVDLFLVQGGGNYAVVKKLRVP